MRHIGFVTGLRFEADILLARARDVGVSDRVDVRASGPGQARAYETARALALADVGLLVSIGLAGGLHPGLKVGDVVLADYVVGPDGERLLVADAEKQHLARALKGNGVPGAQALSFYQGPFAASIDPVLTPAAKKTLHAMTGAWAVDMESDGVARAAHDAGLPFLGVRVISDTQRQSVPAAALAGMNADGTVSPWPVIAGLWKSPGDLPGLLVLGRQSRLAKKCLSRLGERLFGCLF